MPLILAPQGESLTVLRVAAKTEINRRLGDMGIVAGAELTLLSVSSGNAVVCIKGVRVALDRDIARAILVCKMTAA